MKFEAPQAEDLKNESDVEQKFLYPFLTTEQPLGLGIPSSSVQTKSNIRRFVIGKGSDQKSYFPDYIVTISGTPLLVCEGKTPGSDLNEAFREARLYAAELNGLLQEGFNPVRKVIATDGVRMLAGAYDHSQPTHTLEADDFSVYSERIAAFIEEYGFKALHRFYDSILPQIRPTRFWKPGRLVGGISVRNEEVAINSFGATITTDFSHIFNPLNLQDRENIAKNAYVSSKRRERYIEPIDRIIRGAVPPSEARSRTVEDTGSPRESFRALRRTRKLEHQIVLIVGSAGSGKTTFVDHIQGAALPRDLKEKTFWIRINMNPAPISRSEIYDWLRKEIISGCKTSMPDIDFDELDTLLEVNKEQVEIFRKGIGRLYASNKALYDEKLAQHLEGTLSDNHTQAVNYMNFVSGVKKLLPIVVLDNCDKRLRDEQLLMFEAAQWLQREFASLIILPIREETYDNHHNEPPLDTALKDLVFRIEPPLFQKVLQNRVNLALRDLQQRGRKTYRYKLPNGISVEYAASDQASYLNSIMRSIFEHDRYVRRFIVGLSGRNIRRALEIFLQFCTSGHISEDEIYKIRHSEGRHVLPLELVTTVLLRLNQRFYASKGAYLKNLYAIDEHDARPSFFARLIILKLLRNKQDDIGPKRLRGYVHVRDLRKSLETYGVSKDIFFREIEVLAKAYCIFSEDFRIEDISDEMLISLAPAGVVHLQMEDNVHYLSTIAEDTWFANQEVAKSIAERIRDNKNQYSKLTTFYNAVDLFNHLDYFRNTESKSYKAVFNNTDFDALTDLTNAHSALQRYERSIANGPWIGVRERFPVNSVVKGFIASIGKAGITVDVEKGLSGFLPSSNLPPNFKTARNFAKGRNIFVKVAILDPTREKLIFELSAENNANTQPIKHAKNDQKN
jgi:Cdc6-like AAA superfamily ATPase